MPHTLSAQHNEAMSPPRSGAPPRTPPPPRPRGRWRAAWWLLPVLALHLLALWGLVRAFREPPAHSLPPALYTRVLLPSNPPPVATGAQDAQAGSHAGAQAQAQVEYGASANVEAPRHTAQASASAPRGAEPTPRRPATRAHHTSPHAPLPAAARASSPAAPASAPRQTPPSARTHAGSSPTASPPSASSPAASPAAAPSPAASRPAARGTAPAGSAPAAQAPIASADAWPLPTRLDYALTGYYRGPLHGNGELEWRRQGQRYELRLSGSALIDFSYTSSGTIDGDWLAPDEYVEQVLMRSKTVRFDRAAGLLRFSAVGSTMPIPAHLIDSASVFMQLAQRLRTQPEQFRDGSHLRFQVVRPSGTTTWDFLVAGRAPVDTRIGRLDTWHLVYQPPARDDLGAEVWLAPSLQGLPVQIRLLHGGDDYLQFTLRRALQQAPSASASAPPSAPR